MTRIYSTASPVTLLMAGWLLVTASMFIRYQAGIDLPMLNLVIFPLGLAIYFLPPYLAELNQGEALRRKLLWMLIAAGIIMLAWEAMRLFSAG